MPAKPTTSPSVVAVYLLGLLCNRVYEDLMQLDPAERFTLLRRIRVPASVRRQIEADLDRYRAEIRACKEAFVRFCPFPPCPGPDNGDGPIFGKWKRLLEELAKYGDRLHTLRARP
jgi:hypothetical protein